MTALMNKESLPTSLSQKIETVLVKGDLSGLSDQERLVYYNKVCESVGLNPLTKPFDYLNLNNKLVLYATKGCTDQLRNVHKISIEIVSREKIGDVFVVTAKAMDPSGRVDESTGAVSLGKAYGDQLANAYMKAETKAKRRVTLSICGLGLLDESEVESIPNKATFVSSPAKPVAQIQSAAIVDKTTGEVKAEVPSVGVEKSLPGADLKAQVNEFEGLIAFGNIYKGRKFKDVPAHEILSYATTIRDKGWDKSESAKAFLEVADRYVKEFLSDKRDEEIAKSNVDDSDIPF